MEKPNKNKHLVPVSTRRYFPVLWLLFFGIALSLVMFWIARRWEKTIQLQEFESRAVASVNSLEITLDDYVEANAFLGDFINNSLFVSRSEFSGIVASIMPRYPGIQTFGWSPLVKDDERDAYESEARNEGFQDFEFTELSEDLEVVRAARREEYLVAYYMHPMEGNLAAFGYDLASDGTRLNAITEAFDTGKQTATERITLVQETGNQFGVQLFLPIYHQNVPLHTQAERRRGRKGLAVEVVRIGQAIEAGLKGFPDEGISLTLYDMSAEEGKRFLHHRPSQMSKTRDEPIPAEGMQAGFFWSKTLNFAGRQWMVVLSPSESYYQSLNMLQSWGVLVGFLVLTVLLTFYMLRKILYTVEIEHGMREQARTNNMLHDEIKVRAIAEADRDKTILKLQRAIDDVKKLRGVLPICASCKKIRDDRGSWNQLESYIRDHSEAQFSHGICPECAEKLYPEVYKKGQENL